uniref:Uncharacterized protein n=1 Tax=Manihot esculenta TaxID=3983 RepID=A0A2C9U4S1_MANES
MALAGLPTFSMLDSSFLRESQSPTSRRQGAVECCSLMALAGLPTFSMLDSSFLRESQSPTSRRQGAVERPTTQASTILQMWRELEDEHLLNRARGRRESWGSENPGSLVDASESENEFVPWSHEQLGTQNENGDTNGSSREQSPDLSEVERER